MIDHKEFSVEIQNRGNKDCGPACLKMIMRYYDKHQAVQYINELFNVKENVSFYEIRCAAEAMRFRALSFKINVERLRDIVALPVIIHWCNNHFVVVYDIDDEYFYIADPVKGKVKYNFDTVKSNWYPKLSNKGVVMIFEPL